MNVSPLISFKQYTPKTVPLKQSTPPVFAGIPVKQAGHPQLLDTFEQAENHKSTSSASRASSKQ